MKKSLFPTMSLMAGFLILSISGCFYYQDSLWVSATDGTMTYTNFGSHDDDMNVVTVGATLSLSAHRQITRGSTNPEQAPIESVTYFCEPTGLVEIDAGTQQLHFIKAGKVSIWAEAAIPDTTIDVDGVERKSMTSKRMQFEIKDPSSGLDSQNG